MKRFVLFALLFCAAVLLPAQTVTNIPQLQEAAPWLVHMADTRGQRFELATVPGTQEKGIKLSWDEKHHSYAELHLRKPLQLPEFTKANLRLKFYIPANTPIQKINLRLVDKTGEVFQFNYSTPNYPEAGIKTIDYLVNPANLKAGHWSGNNDNKIDFPVALLGFAVDFRPNAGAGELYFAGVEMVSESATVSDQVVTENIVNFTKPDIWRIHEATGRNQTISAGENSSLRITWDAPKFRYLELFPTQPHPLPDFNQATFRLAAKIPTNVAIQNFALRLVDNTGEIFQFTQPVKRANDGTVTLEYPIDINNLSHVGTWGGNNNKKLDFPVSFYGLAINFDPASGQGEASLLSLTMSGKNLNFPTAADKIALEIETGNPIRVLRPGEESKLALTFHNQGIETYQAVAEVEFEDFYTRTFQKKYPLKLAAGEKVSFPVDIKFPAYGIWYVRARLSHADAIPTTISRSFAYFAPTGPTPGKSTGFHWSVSSHTQSKPLDEQKLEAIAAGQIGIKVVREDAYWNYVQPKKGEWRFDRMDQTVGIFEEQGVETQIILCYCAGWAALNKEHGGRSVPEPTAWAEFCRKMAEHYRGRIRFYEVWNEPDLVGFARFTPEAYAQMMLSAYKEIKAVNPQAQVMTGGYATLNDHPSLSDPLFQEKTLVLGRGGYDIHAYHEHGPFMHFYRMMTNRFLPMRERANVTEPWWANETALTSAGGNERPQAEAVYKKLIFAWANGAIGYTWYDLRNDGYNPTDGEHNYGMITKDFYPKAVYPAYNALVQVFRGKEFVKALPLGELHWGFLFQGDGEFIIASWNESGITLPALLLTDAKSVEKVDLMGNVSEYPVNNGQVVLETTITPFSLRFKGASKVEFAGNLITPSSSESAIPGENWSVRVETTNPSQRPAKFDLKLHAPQGFLPQTQERSMTIPAGERKSETFQFNVSSEFKAMPAEEPAVMIEYRNDTGLRGTVRFPVVCGIIIPSGEFDSRKADFVLDQRTQLTSLFPADPHKKHLLWTGPADLSAQVWIGIFGDDLKLRIRATDDIHSQPESGARTWMGDNIQFLLQQPGSSGYWEIGLTHLENGTSEVWCWQTPNGGAEEKKIVDAVQLKTSRTGTSTDYEASIPLKQLGVTPEMLKIGLRFNLLLNDNDGEGREGWLNIAPGIGSSKDPSKAPLLIFQSKR